MRAQNFSTTFYLIISYYINNINNPLTTGGSILIMYIEQWMISFDCVSVCFTKFVSQFGLEQQRIIN